MFLNAARTGLIRLRVSTINKHVALTAPAKRPGLLAEIGSTAPLMSVENRVNDGVVKSRLQPLPPHVAVVALHLSERHLRDKALAVLPLGTASQRLDAQPQSPDVGYLRRNREAVFDLAHLILRAELFQMFHAVNLAQHLFPIRFKHACRHLRSDLAAGFHRVNDESNFLAEIAASQSGSS